MDMTPDSGMTGTCRLDRNVMSKPWTNDGNAGIVAGIAAGNWYFFNLLRGACLSGHAIFIR